MIQFYGIRAQRSRPARAGTEFPDWEVDKRVRLHTVNVSNDLRFRGRKRQK